MTSILSRLLKRSRTLGDLRAAVTAELSDPPFPPDLKRKALGISNAQGISFPDVWRARVEAELRFVAEKATWADQRAAALDCLINNMYWLAVYAASRGSTHPSSWEVFVAHDADFQSRPKDKWELALVQKWLLASATADTMETLLRKEYEYDRVKAVEIELYFETERNAMGARIMLLDRVLSLATDETYPEDVVRAEAAMFDNEIAPQLDRERRLADVLREEIVYRSVDIAACRQQLDELEARRRSLVERLRSSNA